MKPRRLAARRCEPREIAAIIEESPVLPAGQDERFAGYGVMGVPFSSGHYLALRRWPATSVGPAFTSVWWRDPVGRWEIFSSVPPAFSCPRYFGRSLERTETCEIDLVWSGPRSLRVTIPSFLEWEVQLGSTPATWLMNLVGAATPRSLWRSSAGLAVMGKVGGPLLQTGKLRLHGAVPNGQQFQANPQIVWVITASRATIDGQDAGPAGPLAQQTRLGDVWLPQRGIFFVGEAYLEPTGASNHGTLDPAVTVAAPVRS
jgi:hypothetical protein